jgi:hypothetical protein
VLGSRNGDTDNSAITKVSRQLFELRLELRDNLGFTAQADFVSWFALTRTTEFTLTKSSVMMI